MEYETIILSPHIDDAVFSLGGALAAKSFGLCQVVNVYSHSRYTISGCWDTPRITQQRHKEDKAAMTHLSLDVDYCGLSDSSLRAAYADEASYLAPNLLTESDETWGSACSVVSDVIEANPNSFFLAPLGLGHHIDHRIVRDVCLMVPNLFKIAFFEDGTYHRTAHLVKQHAKHLGLTRIWTLLSDGYEKKEEAVNFYTSQLDDSVRSLLRKSYDTYGGERVWTRAGVNLPDHLPGDMAEVSEDTHSD